MFRTVVKRYLRIGKQGASKYQKNTEKYLSNSKAGEGSLVSKHAKQTEKYTSVWMKTDGNKAVEVQGIHSKCPIDAQPIYPSCDVGTASISENQDAAEMKDDSLLGDVDSTNA